VFRRLSRRRRLSQKAGRSYEPRDFRRLLIRSGLQGGRRIDARRAGFFDVDERLRRLTDLGDQLLALAKVVDFEIFRPELSQALAYSEGAKGGRRLTR
jgi:hypothetical protein